MYISFFEVQNDVTLTKYLEMSSTRDRISPFENELKYTVQICSCDRISPFETS